MKTWFTSTASSTLELQQMLNKLEDEDHTIFEILQVSGKIVVVSYTEEQ